MNQNSKKISILYFICVILAIFAGYYANPTIINLANLISNIFVSSLKWLSIPIIFLSILNTTSNMQSKEEFFQVGLLAVKYTLLTTIIAASIALGYFLIINPTNIQLVAFSNKSLSIPDATGVFGIILMTTVASTLILSIFIVTSSFNIKDKVHKIINKSYKYTMKIVYLVLSTMPIAIFAFITLFIQELNKTIFNSLFLYLICILLANLTQALIILPLLLKSKKIPVINSFKGMFPALATAFWSKSSGVALPVAIKCAVENLNIKNKISGFVLPLCTTINMNACSAFILITTLFVSTSHGMVFSNLQLLLWVLIATIVAIGNAGVPMGCYTLTCAILGYMGMPLYLLGLILPFYSLIDMLESAINVWSDACVTLMVKKDLK